MPLALLPAMRSRLKLFFLILLYLLTAPFGAQAEEHVIGTLQFYYNARYPAFIDGDYIVWADLRNNRWDLYLYDLSTNIEHRISTDSAVPTIPTVSGNRIAWQDYRNGNGDIYMCTYNPATGTCPEVPITTHSANQIYPFISGTKIIWSDLRNGNYDIYLYDLSNQTGNPERRLTTNNALQTLAAVSGNRIVWTDERTGSYNVFTCLYNPVNGSCPNQQITSHVRSQYYPFVDGDRIVWLDDRQEIPNGADLYFFDLATNTELAIAARLGHQRFATLSGDLIVWEDERNGNPDIYLFDLETGLEQQITSHPARQERPVISGNRLIWADNRDGSWKIYYTEIQTGTPGIPQINPIPDQFSSEGQPVVVNLTASDPGGRPLTIMAIQANGQPFSTLGAVFTDYGNGTASLRWTPAYHQAGEHSILLRAQNDLGALTEATMTIHVTDVPLSAGKSSASPNPFSPDGDGIAEATIISGSFNHTANWQIEIRDGAGGLRRTMNGTGTLVRKTWDGRDNQSQPLPNGTYFYRITGVDSGGSQTIMQGERGQDLQIVLDTGAPVLSQVSDSPDPFVPSANQVSSIQFTMSEPGYITIRIYNTGGTEIGAPAVNLYYRTAGTRSRTWDGKVNGIPVPAGYYIYRIWFTDLVGHPALAPYPAVGIITVQ